MAEALHFLLTPDRAAPRRTRRAVAGRHALAGALVGTWPELLEQARREYLVPAPPGTWPEALERAARAQQGAFWTHSLEADPDATLAAIEHALAELIQAQAPGPAPGALPEPAGGFTAARAARHLRDFTTLAAQLDGTLPLALATLRSVLETPGDVAIRHIAVHSVPDRPTLNPWQRALIEKLNADAGAQDAAELDAALAACLGASPRATGSVALGHLQRHLFEPTAPRHPHDETLQLLAVRDWLEELEVTAGMIQRALAAEPGLTPADLALLLPRDTLYRTAAEDAFATAGLVLSALDRTRPVRDLGREAIHHLLLAKRPPAPAMARASLFTSPLGPWPRRSGMDLAQSVMDGRRIDLPDDLPPPAAQALRIALRHDTTPAELARSIASFAALLDAPLALENHIAIARALAGDLATRLNDCTDDIPWSELLEQSEPRPVPAERDLDVTREGIAVFDEHEEPWRDVRRLFVLGFSDGRYPSAPGSSPVFSDEDRHALREQLGLELEGFDEVVTRRRELFVRQVSAASESAVFLVPQRDAEGAALTPSGTLTFVARLFEGAEDPKSLVLDLDSEAGRAAARGLALAEPTVPHPPRRAAVKDLELGRSLVGSWTRLDGEPRPESPSSLETLLVSPLAWLLGRAGLEPRLWVPEELTPPLQGGLAHDIFEHLFPAGGAIPSDAEIHAAVPELLREATRRLAPFLARDAMRVERRNLESSVTLAAVRWRELLVELDARVVATEVHLEGQFEGVALAGRADALLALANGNLCVVDYKKSSSSRFRTRMQKGYDSQTTLYRSMLVGGRVDPRDEDRRKELEVLLAGKPEMAVLYYAMNDQDALSDTGLGPAKRLEHITDAIAENALPAIRERLSAAGSGRVELNRIDDAERWDKVGIGAYALDRSPLIGLFSHPAAEEDGGAP